MTQDSSNEQDQPTDRDGNAGQVSEVAAGGSGPEAVSAGDSVAGQPDQESGEVQEGAQGPNAIPEDETGEHPHQT
ncbi:hypothetical protein SAMN05192575_103273 [Nocardioides alpinus]|uniref:Uncharacterized protein n=1 Tax=Nocardioides alpinus TaxID=748909 RepID=A0A1I0Y678_9ACTN|nr:hypothetical protein [Nocardioides alpinus]PKH39033.1 hypothetical protein CXG46_15020 [Nocardioides alpinus]SFB08714.1 hypothetical protein SAMN05192575_103273 [Nocardioides alpinus]